LLAGHAMMLDALGHVKPAGHSSERVDRGGQ
jgi:hypothetical protein